MKCPSCGKQITVKNEDVNTVRCPHCGRYINLRRLKEEVV